MSTFLQRMTAWLCLAATFLTGLTPAQEFMLCFEPTGGVSLDLATVADRCVCCDAHEQGPLHGVQAPAAPDEICDCLDVPLPGTAQDRLIQRGLKLPQPGPWIVPESGADVVVLASRAPLNRARRAEVPRPPGSLALVRSVVLLI